MFRRPSKRNQTTHVSKWVHFYKEYNYRKPNELVCPGGYSSLDQAIKARRNDIEIYNFIMTALNLKLIHYDDNAVFPMDNSIVLSFMYPAEYSKYFEDKNLITLLQ